MSGMFSECSSLSSLPDLSKWNTNNIIDMSYMFYEYLSLLLDLFSLNEIFINYFNSYFRKILFFSKKL